MRAAAEAWPADSLSALVPAVLAASVEASQEESAPEQRFRKDLGAWLAAGLLVETPAGLLVESLAGLQAVASGPEDSEQAWSEPGPFARPAKRSGFDFVRRTEENFAPLLAQ